MLQELVGPLVAELVGVREPLAGQEDGARIADGDPVAELLADRDERRDMVARAEEIELRAWGVGLDEDLLALARLHDRALADLEQRLCSRRGGGVRAVAVHAAGRGVDPLLAEAIVLEVERERDRLVVAHRLGDRPHDLRVETVDGDGDPAAAVQAHIEAVVIVQAIVDEPGRGAVEYLHRLADHRGLDAAAGHAACHPVLRRDGERCAGIAGSRPDPFDHGPQCDGGSFARPPLQDLDDVLH